MNKLLQTMLVSAVMATSGMATQGMLDLQGGGEVQKDAVIDFNGQALNLAPGTSLGVYGSLTGTGTITCSGTGQVNVYNSTYQDDTANAEAIKTAAALETTITAVHTLDDTVFGSISEGITVEPSSALHKTDADLAKHASGLESTDLVYVANSTGDAIKCIGGTDSATVRPRKLS